MKAAPIPDDDGARVAALQRYQVLDTLPEQVFDDLTLLASHLCAVPISLVSLVDVDRQWFKSRVGLGAEQTPRDISFCGHAVVDRSLLVVPDTLKDPRFADNPLVLGAPDIRFYAGAPLVTSDNFVLGTICVIDRVPRHLSDEQLGALEAISRQVISQLELRLAGAVALRATHVKSVFLANMSHELRTPLNAIIGFTNVLRKDPNGRLTARDQLLLSRVAANGDHLLSLINDVLDLSRLEADELALTLTAVDVRHLSLEVVAGLVPVSRQRGVTITVTGAADLPPLTADERALRQVLLNLLGNALKFTRRGVVELHLHGDAGGLRRIDVIDAGLGLSAEALQRVFAPFQQAHDTTARKHGGTGLGLSISRSLCERHGWRLDAVSEPGLGSIFFVLLDDEAQAPSFRPPVAQEVGR